jgi:trk system potassium uptake protein TrkH
LLHYSQVRRHHLERARKPSPARGSKILVLGFALIIFVGTLLLMLPTATEGPAHLSFLEALFTATSATTVTGLVIFSTHATFSTFGEIVILLLIQVGGVGFITLSVVLFRLIGRRVTIYERILLSQTLGVTAGKGIVRLTLTVLFITIAIEFMGAIFLFTQWVQIMDWPHAAYYAIFHSISAFCNAGFDLFKGLDDPALEFSRQDPIILIVMSLLITIGALGITVIYDVIVWPRERHLSLHTRLVLPLSLVLVVMGTSLMLLDEYLGNGHALTVVPLGKEWLLALFTVVSSRTAGITFIFLPDLGQASQLMLFVWMFIGGAPASMGGGVGISTIAVVLVTLASTVRGHNKARIFERTIPVETIFKAIAVLAVSAILVVLITVMAMLFGQGQLFPIAFEVVSAFSNTGYSLDVTSDISWIEQLLLIFTMFWGRLGPLTLIVALAQRRRQSLIDYPEEKIIIG